MISVDTDLHSMVCVERYPSSEYVVGFTKMLSHYPELIQAISDLVEFFDTLRSLIIGLHEVLDPIALRLQHEQITEGKNAAAPS
jgi:hypothetical protein